MRRLVGILGLLLVVSMVAGTAVAAEQPQFTYEELSERGTQIEGQDPSSRYLGDRGMVYVSYRETNFIKEMSQLNEPSWAVDKVITPGQVVDTNEVTLHISRWRNAPSATATVHVVQWHETTRTIEEGNTTRTETIAANITHLTKEIELTGGGDRVTVSLPNTGPKRMVTMWIEGYEGARWVFAHDPVATTNATPFDATWSSFLPWFLTRFFAVTLIGAPLAIYAGVGLLETVGASPGKGMVWWILVPGFLTYMAGYLALGRIADLVVSFPWVLGGVVVAFTFIATLEFADDSFRLLFEQVTTTGSVNAIGEDVQDVAGEAGVVVDAVQLDDETLALVKHGSLTTWLVVALTDAEWPTIHVQDLETRITYEKLVDDVGRTVADAKIYLDEREEQALEVTWPTLDLGMSALKVRRDDQPAGGEEGDATDVVLGGYSRDRLANAFMAFSLGTLAGSTYFGFGPMALAVGGLPLLFVMSRSGSGRATYNPSPFHGMKAKAARLAEEREMSIARTFEDLKASEDRTEDEILEMAVELSDSRVEGLRETLFSLFGMDEPGTPATSSEGT
ncbi:MAG: hypothetical protein ABEJ47_01280, partial [Halorhabdus sp.]